MSTALQTKAVLYFYCMLTRITKKTSLNKLYKERYEDDKRIPSITCASIQ